ncbi:MAG: DUF2029 domain-containing protein [Gammaproteobacteria bacterium]|nr:DUF2029 domain-containing protein [Gammaproteobacteria bacterium]
MGEDPRPRMLIKSIRTGSWVTPRRLRLYPLIYLTVSLALILYAAGLGRGLLDPDGKALGTDFMSFWSVSNLLWQGRPAAAYDHEALHAIQQSLAGAEAPLYTWLYPPMALLLVAPLAAMPYLPALLAWLGLTLVGYLSVLWRLLPDRRALLPMLAFAPLFINLGHGQNAFLTVTLLGWGLILLPRRPWLAGVLLGALVYKPQLGLLLPIALAAAGHWRAFLTATLTVLALAGLTYGLWGTEVWSAFFTQTAFARQMLEQGLVPWYKMISVFGAVRMLGAPLTSAWAIQLLLGLVAAVVVWRIWRAPAPQSLKIAVVPAAILVTAPLALDYDGALLAMTLVACVSDGLRRGFLDWEISILALAWLTPLFWRPLAQLGYLPLGTLISLALLWLTWRRVQAGCRQQGV